MYAAIQNKHLLTVVADPVECESFARGFERIEDFFAWRDDLPKDHVGMPKIPAAPHTVIELRAELQRKYDELRAEDFQIREIAYVDGELSGDEDARAQRLEKKRWNEVRARRNELLTASDKYMIPDYPITDAEREQWRRYRKNLRELPKKFSDPDGIEWPEPPAG